MTTVGLYVYGRPYQSLQRPWFPLGYTSQKSDEDFREDTGYLLGTLKFGVQRDEKESSGAGFSHNRTLKENSFTRSDSSSFKIFENGVFLDFLGPLLR
ncbi:hypothetical protein J6590_066237 [Homalodisca vitripennis]|nr:hypothetical protein J6590_066237 [Homalodisca vitripennis]